MTDKKPTKTKIKKQIEKNLPQDLSETDLDSVQGAREFFNANLTQIKWPTADAKDDPNEKPSSNTLTQPKEKN